jgi:hypothetical protein
MPTHAINLEVHKSLSSIPPQVVVRQGEAGTETIEASITDEGVAYTSELSSVRLDILHADGTWARVTASKSGSKVLCTLPSEALSSKGLCKLAHFVFFGGDKVESTEGFELRILPAVECSSEEAQNYDDLLTGLYEKWTEYEKTAEAQESARQTAEDERKTSESARQSAETERQSAETARTSAEAERAAAEATRVEQEATRESNESARQEAETARQEAEETRASNEETRQSNEAARQSAETERATQQAKNNADQAANNAAAQGLQVYVCQSGEYDTTSLEPTITGNAGKLYFVPDGSASGDSYIEWMYIDSTWERVGMSNATLVAVTTDEIDTVASSGTGTGEQVLNLTGLAYLWAKIKAAFAAIAHTHAATDITSGTLPIARGGTGATTADAALTSLGAASATDLESLRYSVSQVIISRSKTISETGTANSFHYVGLQSVSGYVPFAARFEWSGSSTYHMTTGISRRNSGSEYFASIMCEATTITGTLIVYYVKQ